MKQHYISKTTDMESGFRPLADLGAKLEEIEAQLATEGMSAELEQVRTEKARQAQAPAVEASFEEQLAAEGMPAELEPTDAASLDGKLAVVTADATQEMAHSAEDVREYGPPSRELLPEQKSGPSREDHELLERLKELGWAAHPALLEDYGAAGEQLAKLSGLGLAHMRATGSGDRVFAMAGATDSDVERAAEWLAGQREAARRTAMGSRACRIARSITRRLRRLGGACSEEGLYGSLVSFHPREAVDAVVNRMVEAGKLGRTSARWSPHTILLLQDAGEEEITTASQSLLDLARRAAHRRHALRQVAETARKEHRTAPSMRLVEPISESSSHGEHDDRPEAGTVLKADPAHFWAIWAEVRERIPSLDYASARELLDALPFKATLEAAGWESTRSRNKRQANLSRMRAECIARRREGRPLVVVPAAELDARRSSPAHSIVARKAIRRERLRKLFRKTLQRRSPERIALDTAKAVLLSGESEPTRRLLVALGAAPTTHLDASSLSEGFVRRDFIPVRLTDEGRAVMSRRLLAVLADPSNGIHVPEHSKLARKVAAYSQATAREALATEAEAKTPLVGAA